MDKVFKTQPHTVYLLMGPSECGKSFFANYLRTQLIKKSGLLCDWKPATTHILSSDDIRKELLGYNYNKMDIVMNYPSKQAFNLLYTKLKSLISYPINAEFVIVDTTGLSKKFRDDIMDIAHTNHYNIELIFFKYKEREDYFRIPYSSPVVNYINEKLPHKLQVITEKISKRKINKRLIAQHIKRLNEELRPGFKKGFTNTHKINSRDFKYKIEVNKLKYYKSHFLSMDKEYLIIGDVHESLKELTLLSSNYLSKRNTEIIVIGDYVDKGNNTANIINFLWTHRNKIRLILGNHENHVYKYLKGEIKKVDQELEDNYFISSKLFLNNEQLKRRFFDLVEMSRNFYIYRDFIVTHAPCQEKYLGKIDSKSLKKQQTFVYAKRERKSNHEWEEEIKSQLLFLKEEAANNFPRHIFGHIPTSKILRIKNKFGIDTGCVQGGELTGIIINGLNKPFITTVKSKTPQLKPLINLNILFRRNQEAINLDNLDYRTKIRIEYMVKDKINFLNPTMSPADKNSTTNELESLEKGLQYYRDKGIEKVVIEPKYMGSYCDIYLHKEIEKCGAFSRNGYKIKSVDMNPIYQKLHSKFEDFFNTQNVLMLIISGELMPWFALGENLINTKFEVINKALQIENNLLKKYGFNQQYNSLLQEYNQSGYAVKSNKVSKKHLDREFGPKHKTFKHLKGYQNIHQDLGMHNEALQVYSNQMILFGQEEEVYYKPFNLLKTVYIDGTEKLCFDKKTEDMFKLVSDDDFLVVYLEHKQALEQVQDYYNTTINQNLEGIVIKPEDVYNSNTAPAIKVRNPNYLTIIYGYDYKFTHKYQKLFKQKSINRKLRTSIKEWELNRKLLEIRQEDITMENSEYLKTIISLITEETKEKGIDPRL